MSNKRRGGTERDQISKRIKETPAAINNHAEDPPTLRRTRSQTALAGSSSAAQSNVASARNTQQATQMGAPRNASVGNAGPAINKEDLEEAFRKIARQLLTSKEAGADMQKALEYLGNIEGGQKELEDQIDGLDLKYEAELLLAVSDIKQRNRKITSKLKHVEEKCDTLAGNQDKILHILHQIHSKLSTDTVKKEESVELPLNFQDASDIPVGSPKGEHTTSPLPPSSPLDYTSGEDD